MQTFVHEKRYSNQLSLRVCLENDSSAKTISFFFSNLLKLRWLRGINYYFGFWEKITFSYLHLLSYVNMSSNSAHFSVQIRAINLFNNRSYRESWLDKVIHSFQFSSMLKRDYFCNVTLMFISESNTHRKYFHESLKYP